MEWRQISSARAAGQIGIEGGPLHDGNSWSGRGERRGNIAGPGGAGILDQKIDRVTFIWIYKAVAIAASDGIAGGVEVNSTDDRRDIKHSAAMGNRD